MMVFTRAPSSESAFDLEQRRGALNYHPLPVCLSRGSGVYVWDVEGNQYLDFLAAYSAVNQGHCHPRIIGALVEQASRLTLASRAFYNDALGPFEQYLTDLFGYDRVLPANTGVEAVETAIKLCRRWGYEKKKVPDNEAKIVVCKGNFHGRTLAAISASTSAESRRGFGPYAPGFVVVPFGNIERLSYALEDPTVTGFLVEPIQGEGGVILPPKDYLRQAKELCQSRNVLFMADEIQTGLGRTGAMLACDHEGVRPDVLLLGKALSGGVLPVSAVLADDGVMLCIRPGEHGSTYGGNPLACQVAMAALEVLQTEGLIENSRVMGEIFRAELADLEGDKVMELRGVGLMNALQIAPNPGRSAWDICVELQHRGLLAKPTQGDTIRLTPPLVISEEQVRLAASIIREVVTQKC